MPHHQHNTCKTWTNSTYHNHIPTHKPPHHKPQQELTIPHPKHNPQHPTPKPNNQLEHIHIYVYTYLWLGGALLPAFMFLRSFLLAREASFETWAGTNKSINSMLWEGITLRNTGRDKKVNKCHGLGGKRALKHWQGQKNK